MGEPRLVNWGEFFNGREPVDIVPDLDADPGLIEAQDEVGMTLLTQVVAFRDHRVIAELLRRGANPNVLDETGYWPLRLAVESGDIAGARLLLEAGAHPTHPMLARNGRGRHPFVLETAPRAAVYGDGGVEMLELLISAGADVNMPDVDGYTPLHTAADMGREDAARVLLNAGADRVAQDMYGQTPAELAAEQGHHDLARLLGAEPPPRPRDQYGRRRG